MAEYIDKNDLREYISGYIKSCNGKPKYTDMDAMVSIISLLEQMPAVDVQPVDRWISVNDRLPEADYDCFVWYSCDTAFGKSKSWGIAHCSRCDWYTKHLDGDNIVVLYWMPCPKPPEED